MAHNLTDFLERLASHYGLGDDLAALAALEGSLVPAEASVSLDGHATEKELRCTLGAPARPEDSEGRQALRAALELLGAGPAGAAADEALARAARGAPKRRYARAIALRARPGRVRPRVGSWIGGETVGERCARITNVLRGLGLDGAAQSHASLTNVLVSNPFSATFPYGIGLDLTASGIDGAKTYFASESAEVLLGHVHGPIAQALGLQGATKPFDSLVAVAGSNWRRTRWLLEASFELPRDPSLGTRVKLYLTPSSLAATDSGPHRAIVRLAADIGLDCTPYEELVGVLGPGDFVATMMAGVSVSAAGCSLEVYVFVRPWVANWVQETAIVGRDWR